MSHYVFVFQKEDLARKVENLLATKLSRFHAWIRGTFQTECFETRHHTNLVVHVQDSLSLKVVQALVLEAIEEVGYIEAQILS